MEIRQFMTDDRSKKAVEAFANGFVNEKERRAALEAYALHEKWGIFYPSPSAWAAKAAYQLAQNSKFDGNLTWEYAKAAYEASVNAGVTTPHAYSQFLERYENEIAASLVNQRIDELESEI